MRLNCGTDAGCSGSTRPGLASRLAGPASWELPGQAIGGIFAALLAQLALGLRVIQRGFPWTGGIFAELGHRLEDVPAESHALVPLAGVAEPDLVGLGELSNDYGAVRCGPIEDIVIGAWATFELVTTIAITEPVAGSFSVDQDVVSGQAVESVIARATAEGIITWSTIQPVLSFSSLKHISALSTPHSVVTVSTIQDIVATDSPQSVHAVTTRECVIIGTTVELVLAFSSREGVVTTLSPEDIIAISSLDVIISGTSNQSILAITANYVISTFQAKDLVITTKSEDYVIVLAATKLLSLVGATNQVLSGVDSVNVDFLNWFGRRGRDVVTHDLYSIFFESKDACPEVLVGFLSFLLVSGNCGLQICCNLCLVPLDRSWSRCGRSVSVVVVLPIVRASTICSLIIVSGVAIRSVTI